MPELAVCRHFGVCGGCALQHLSDHDYVAYKQQLVKRALARHGLDVRMEEMIRVPARTRRRAGLKAHKANGAVEIGFHATASHIVVDLQECLVLSPGLFATIAGLREILSPLLREGETAEMQATEASNGVDLVVSVPGALTPARTAEFSTRSAQLGMARVTLNGEIVFAHQAPQVQIAGTDLELPEGGFLQPTREGEAQLQAIARDWLAGCRRVCDLFSGCGTFALALARLARVHAVDADAPMLAALEKAVRHGRNLKPVSTEQRNLNKRPLSASELSPFDGVLLDPPRAGALAQASELARSTIRRVCYVSCDPESFARDARTMVAGGYELRKLFPIDQFLWADHIELAGLFERRRNAKPGR